MRPEVSATRHVHYPDTLPRRWPVHDRGTPLGLDMPPTL